MRPGFLGVSAPYRLAMAVAALVLLLTLGIGGYMGIEGWPLLDAAYMTVTTITTVGFREVRPLSDGGRIFTILLIVLGVGVLFYTLTSAVQFIIEGELLDILGVRRMKGQIESLANHYILCGFGRVGEEIAQELQERRLPFVIVESNPEPLRRVQRYGYLVVEGDAGSDSTLLAVGLRRARCLLAASDSDAGNTFIVLAAKALNPAIHVIARAAQPENEARMIRAGADRVVSPYILAGRRMALAALQPMMVDFIDTLATTRARGQILAEIEITEESGLVGRSIREALHSCPSAVVLGLQKPTGEIQVGPRPTTALATDDRLIVLGDEAELEAISGSPSARSASQSG